MNAHGRFHSQPQGTNRAKCASRRAQRRIHGRERFGFTNAFAPARRKEERDTRLAALGEGPREVIANVLIQEAEALAGTVRNLLRFGAAGDLKAAQTLVCYLDQGLGEVQQATGQVSSQDAPLASLTREERAQVGAVIEDMAREETRY